MFFAPEILLGGKLARTALCVLLLHKFWAFGVLCFLSCDESYCSRCDCEDHCCPLLQLGNGGQADYKAVLKEVFLARDRAGWRKSNEGSNQCAMCQFSLLVERSNHCLRLELFTGFRGCGQSSTS